MDVLAVRIQHVVVVELGQTVELEDGELEVRRGQVEAPEATMTVEQQGCAVADQFGASMSISSVRNMSCRRLLDTWQRGVAARGKHVRPPEGAVQPTGADPVMRRECLTTVDHDPGAHEPSGLGRIEGAELWPFGQQCHDVGTA